jgi:YHS domain-containing protein
MNPLPPRQNASDATRPFFFGLLVAVLFALGASAAIGQTNESPNVGPLRTISDGADAKVMLYGHDAVAYFTRNEAVKGDPAITAEHLGVTWRFASEANRAEFVKAPEKYMPQFGGYCSNGVNYAIPGGGGGGPNSWRIYRGKLYVFGGQSARDHFEMDTELNLQRAHTYWNEELAGANPTWTRLRRFIFRVPHYKTDRALQEEWDAKLAAKALPVMPGAPQVVPAR